MSSSINENWLRIACCREESGGGVGRGRYTFRDRSFQTFAFYIVHTYYLVQKYCSPNISFEGLAQT